MIGSKAKGYLGREMTPGCLECGAPLPPGPGTCRARFHDLLALESRIPGGPGAMAHHLAVTSYNLQHPAAFTSDARTDMLAGLAGALAGELTIADLRERTRRKYDGPRRVLRQRGVAPGDPGNAPVPGWPTRWERTVLHALAAEPEQNAYHTRVREWAETVLGAVRSRLDPNG